jgi:hypothetical protein
MISLVCNITNIHESPCTNRGMASPEAPRANSLEANVNHILVFFRKGQVKQVKWVSGADRTKCYLVMLL